MLTNNTGPANLLAAVKTTKATGGTAIVALTGWTLAPAQNLNVAAGDVVTLVANKVLSGGDLDDLAVTVAYKLR
jgi:hypothetical protein